MRNRTTMHDVAVIGSQSHDVLAVFGHVKTLAAILIHVGYPKTIVRCRTTSRDIVRRRGSPYDICAMVVRRCRTTSSMIYDVVGLHLGSYDIARPSYDRRTTP